MMSDEKIPPVDQIKKDISVFKRYKTYIISLCIGIASAGGTMIGLWKGVTEPTMSKMIEAEIESNNKYRDSIHNVNSGSFRGELGLLFDVKKEMVSMTLYLRLDSLSKFMHEAQKYEELLEKFSTIRLLSPYQDENGDEWQPMLDGRDYRVNYDNGQRWVVYHGHRSNL